TLFLPGDSLLGGNVGVVPIKGIITTGDSASFWEEKGTPSEQIVEWIKEADKSKETKAILLEIDSPGGSPVATEEIARAVKDANKTVVAVIRETGASGAYWVASAADYIFASKMSLTGSIGVAGSRLEFAGLLKDYNVTYRRLVSGKYKDAGTRWKEMTPEEEELFQKMLDEVHTEFIHAVAENRNLPVEKVKELAHGFVFTGAQAKELGLVDAIGNKDDAIKYIEQKLNITAETYEFKPTKSLFEEIIGISSQNIGYGIGTALTKASISESVKITT
ncbi:MAG: signal peptide peptidase SppA, partial [Candidatus Woesearchaeota archaeon]